MSKTKLYKLSNTLIGLLFGLLACWYLYSVFQERASEFRTEQLLSQLKQSFGLFLLVVILMPVNWFLETLKWRSLVQEVSEVSLFRAIRSVMFGVSLSLLTPNRVGELGGRLLFIPKSDQLKVLYANTLCSFSQLLVTIIVGLLMIPFYPVKLGISQALLWLIITLVISFSIYIYFSSTLVKRLIARLNDRFQLRKLEVLIEIPTASRLRTLMLSTIRYGVFLSQFSILICIFDAGIPFRQAVLASGIIFLIATLIPTAWISDLPVRTSAAFFIMEQMGYSGSAALLSSLLLWCINLLLPALLGLIEFRNVNWIRLKNLSHAD